MTWNGSKTERKCPVGSATGGAFLCYNDSMDTHGESGRTAPGTLCQYTSVCPKMAKVTVEIPNIGPVQMCYEHEEYYGTLTFNDNGKRYGIRDHEGKQNFVE